jgi:hypothetical protein
MKAGSMIEPEIALSAHIVPALEGIGLHSPLAERLMMGTAAIESDFTHFVQIGGGPARGMFQMEPATFEDIVNRYLAAPGNAALRRAAFALARQNPPRFGELEENHRFAAALARIKYRMIPAPIPASLDGQAHYWWDFYNGRSPHGLKPTDYINRWNARCAPIYPDFV